MASINNEICNLKKVSNLFELLVVSSKDSRFYEWIKCFELLFDTTADQIIFDYNELVSLVEVTTTTYQYNDRAASLELHYNWTTLLPNRNRFSQANLFYN